MMAPSAPANPTPRFLPLLLLLFVGSGCAALIYEIVWFQLIELVIGSPAGVPGRAPWHVHGWHVPRQPAAAAFRLARAAPVAGVRGSRGRHRHSRTDRARG